MGGGVGRVVKLAGDEGVGDLLGQFLCLFNGAGHPLGPGGEDQFRPVGGHQQAALHAHGVGHDDDSPVAPGGGHHGQADARVARGGFDDDGVRLQQAAGLGVVQHGLGHPVFGRAGGIQIFQFGQEGGLQPLLLGNPGQFQQGGPADELFHGGVDFTHGMYPPLYGMESFLPSRAVG